MKNLINNSVQNQLFDAMQTLEKTSETLPHTRDAKQLLTDLFTAYYSARKNKRRKNSQIQFEKNYEENIIILWEQIENRTYSPKPSTVFIKTKPVIREVFAANFQDRIIHHYLFNVLSPIFEKDFIKDSYSCRKGKGTLYGINRVQGFLKEMHHSRSNAYILKLDIQNYFYSIDRVLLYEIVKKKIEESTKNNKIFEYEKNVILFLLKTVIFNDPTNNVIKKGKKAEWEKLPKSKSLFHAKKGKGLAIGNITSQLFSNIYMNPLDHFIKEKLQIKYYGRYVDDFVVVHSSKEYLKVCKEKIQDFLNFYGLTLHPKKIYVQHYKKGLPFLGAYIKPFVKYVENRTKKNIFKLVHTINNNIDDLKNENFSKETLEKIRQQLNSYLGIIQHHNSYLLRKKIFHSLHSEFWKYFWYRSDYSAVGIR